MESLGRPWTKSDDQTLIDGAGVFAMAWFERKLGRSRDAIESRARHVCGPGGLSRGTYSLRSLMRETGYTEQQVLRARSALGQKWKRLGPRGRYLITFEQHNDVVAWLSHDYWCARLRLYRCLNCGHDERRAEGMGLCTTCYSKIRRKMVAAGHKPGLQSLRVLAESLEAESVVLRAMVEQLAKGRGPTEAQLEELLEATG